MALAISRMMVTAILREPLRSQSALVRNAFGHSGVARTIALSFRRVPAWAFR
jgi:hypothetical protein